MKKNLFLRDLKIQYVRWKSRWIQQKLHQRRNSSDKVPDVFAPSGEQGCRKLGDERVGSGESGFTLVELMVVVVIVSILAAVAIPAYSHYTRRAKITEGLILSNPVKMAVSEYIVDRNQSVIRGASNTAVGIASPDELSGRSVQSISVEDNGSIRIEYKDDLGVLYWTPHYDPRRGNIHWECTYPKGSDIADDAPKECASHA